jgi:hypothetical protein
MGCMKRSKRVPFPSRLGIKIFQQYFSYIVAVPCFEYFTNCFSPQYTGHFQILLFFFFWSQSFMYAPELIEKLADLCFFIAQTSESKVYNNFSTMILTTILQWYIRSVFWKKWRSVLFITWLCRSAVRN